LKREREREETHYQCQEQETREDSREYNPNPLQKPTIPSPPSARTRSGEHPRGKKQEGKKEAQKDSTDQTKRWHLCVTEAPPITDQSPLLWSIPSVQQPRFLRSALAFFFLVKILVFPPSTVASLESLRSFEKGGVSVG
jgi:hypothetical protein